MGPPAEESCSSRYGSTSAFCPTDDSPSMPSCPVPATTAPPPLPSAPPAPPRRRRRCRSAEGTAAGCIVAATGAAAREPVARPTLVRKLSRSSSSGAGKDRGFQKEVSKLVGDRFDSGLAQATAGRSPTAAAASSNNDGKGSAKGACVNRTARTTGGGRGRCATAGAAGRGGGGQAGAACMTVAAGAIAAGRPETSKGDNPTGGHAEPGAKGAGVNLVGGRKASTAPTSASRR
mmetsp:Transcript_151807/g.487124  ORF Transcript_151807/g.487124 Transcript_151807/m.487124 type:complete len:233 (+) Transcript_151807:1107-1805(+)